MKIKVETSTFETNKLYFSLKKESGKMLFQYFDSCKEVSNFLNLNINIYNERLIKKVIKHPDFSVSESTKDENLYKDIIFCKKSIDRKTYIERFEKEFVNELVLAILGGE